MARIPTPIEVVVKNLSDNYDLALHVNQGGNGYIFKGKNRILDQEVMLKFYDWSDAKRAHQEPLTMRNIEHPNVLRVLHAGFGDADWAYFVTPYMKDGTLDNYISQNPIRLRQAASMLCKIASGICEMHGKNVIHRDLKPANVFLEGDKPVVGDFGSIVHTTGLNVPIASNSKHSIIYRPPEAVKEKNFSTRSDVYQLGIIFYQLLGGVLPYEEFSWLSKSEKLIYDSLEYPENTIFADNCICARISGGRLLNLNTLPHFVNNKLKRIIKTSCSIDPSLRYPTTAHLLAAVNNEMSNLSFWSRDRNGVYLLEKEKKSICINADDLGIKILQKGRNSEWRNTNRFGSFSTLQAAVMAIQEETS